MNTGSESIAGARGSGPGFSRGRWFLPSLLAVAVGGGMALAAAWVKLPEPPAPANGASRAAPDLVVTRLRALPAGGEVRERLRLLDPTPLFLPGGVGAEASGTAARLEQRQGGAVGAGIPPALAFADQSPARDILRPQPPRSGLEAEKWGAADRWFAGMSRKGDVSDLPAPLKSAGGSLEVFSVGRGERVAKVELPEGPALSAPSWRPLELRVLVDAAGPVALPAIIRGSGVDEVDEFLRETIAKEVLPRLRLRPGAYRLMAGP